MFAMVPPCSELDPKVVPLLLVPIQVIWLEPSVSESQLTSAYMSSLGSWTPPFEEDALISMRIGLVRGDAKRDILLLRILDQRQMQEGARGPKTRTCLIERDAT